jgi:hypothetical protein
LPDSRPAPEGGAISLSVLGEFWRSVQATRRAWQDHEATVNDKASQDSMAAADPDRTKASMRLDPSEILASVGAALYRWDIKSDVLTWSANAGDVLFVGDLGLIGSGRA